jgi:hypothetical protein
LPFRVVISTQLDIANTRPMTNKKQFSDILDYLSIIRDNF